MVIFTSRRNKPEVVVPAQATPREVKTLSDMDNQVGVRVYLTALHFFRLAAPEGQEPDQVASTLKDALARALVYYYPLAGRAREVPGAGGKKLVVDCSAEGAVFVEAHADVRLEELGKPVVKPHPCIAEFMCDVGDVRDVVNKPLLYLQMTQLGCGGVVLALSVSHSLVDVTGMYQVLRCITDLARGQAAPTVLPTWERQLLVASSQEEEAEEEEAKAATMTPPPPSLNDAVVTRYFLFGPREMAALRTAVPAATVFELITAAVWRCRAMALQYPPQQTVRLFFMVNGRGAWKCDPPLPRGFYGNAGFITNAESSAAELYGAPLDHAVGLVHQAKLRFTDQRVRSYLAMMPRGKHSHGPEVALHWSSFIVSDVTRCVDDSLDIGSWAQHVGGGPAVARDMGLSSPCVLKSCKDTNGDKCVLVPICLPELAMGRFASQIAALTGRSSC